VGLKGLKSLLPCIQCSTYNQCSRAQPIKSRKYVRPY
jgi:hypothetical protein